MTDRSATTLPGRYWRQWWASAVSNLGDGINFAALPLLAYSLTDDERLLSLTTFAVIVPWLVLALPVGVAVDRHDRRLLMVGANLVRLALYGVIAVAVAADGLSIWLLLGMLAVIGACEVVFDSSAQAFLPMIVTPRDLPRANGYLLAAEVVAGSLVGLSIGAALYQAADGLPFAINAASFGVAALLILGIRVASAPKAASAPPASGFADGIAWLRSEPLLRTLAWMLAITNLALMLGQGIFVKYAAVELGVTGTGYGLLLAVTAAGAALGGFFGHRVVRAFGLVATILVPYFLFGLGQLVFGTSPPVAVAAVTGLVMGAAITTWNVGTVSLRQQLIPTDLFGRVNSVYRWIGTGASAVGAVAGGVLAYQFDLQTPYLVGGTLTMVALAVGVAPVVAGVRRVAPGLTASQPAERTPAPPSIT